MICVSIGNIGFGDALSIATRASMIEIRQDLSRYSAEELTALINASGRSIITVRPGAFDEEERLEIFSLALEKGASYADIEEDGLPEFTASIKDLTLKYHRSLIISYHNYEQTPSPDVLESILKKCYTKGADVAKIATLVRQDEDIVNLLSLYRKEGRKIILGMGEKGMITRVASVPLGAEFTFASPDGSAGTAPGQLKEHELKEIYDILKINEL